MTTLTLRLRISTDTYANNAMTGETMITDANT